jgi:2-polyprenyl-3-methyl-5-hydroxy-6-metoxy-1,4-benzoquinol methylase
MSLKSTLAKIIPIRRRKALTPGIAAFGINLFYERQAPGWQAQYALEYSLKLKPRTVLDVGSGGGRHARLFCENGAQVDCIDFGTSIYSAENNNQKTHPSIRTFHMDFNEFQAKERYDLVWASHVLEHQRNVGQFLDKLVNCCAPDGHTIITVPDMHRVLCGLLAYNCVLSGVNLRHSKCIRGSHEFTLIFQPHRITLPRTLSYDFGDIRLLAAYLPKILTEGGDPWVYW